MNDLLLKIIIILKGMKNKRKEKKKISHIKNKSYSNVNNKIELCNK